MPVLCNLTSESDSVAEIKSTTNKLKKGDAYRYPFFVRFVTFSDNSHFPLPPILHRLLLLKFTYPERSQETISI